MIKLSFSAIGLMLMLGLSACYVAAQPTTLPTATMVNASPTAVKPVTVPTPSVDWGPALGAVTAVTQDVVKRAGVDAGQVTFAKVEAVEWNDSSLGCPRPGAVYLQVITPGWLIEVQVGVKTFEYHTNYTGNVFVLCKET